MKNAVVIGVAACASAFCQTAGPQFQLIPLDPGQNVLNQRLKDPKLLNFHSAPAFGLSTAPAPAVSPAASVCAIPLLNALPAAGKIDYKMRVLPAPAVGARGSIIPFTSGGPPFPPCRQKK